MCSRQVREIRRRKEGATATKQDECEDRRKRGNKDVVVLVDERGRAERGWLSLPSGCWEEEEEGGDEEDEMVVV